MKRVFVGVVALSLDDGGTLDAPAATDAVTAGPIRLEITEVHERTGGEVIDFPAVDQYTREGDAFSSAVLAGTHPPVPLEDGIRNMEVLDAIFRSAESGGWEDVGG